MSEIKIKIPEWIQESENDLPDNMGGQWGFIKHKMGEFSRVYGAKLKKSKLLLKANIEKELESLKINLNLENKARYEVLQGDLNEIIETEIKGTILRSLCEEYEQGEKCSKYFFSLEKFRGKQKTISRLKRADGSLTSDSKIILEECRKFYQNLYDSIKFTPRVF